MNDFTCEHASSQRGNLANKMILRLSRVANVAIVAALLYLSFAQRVDAKEAINIGSLSTQEVEEQLQVCCIS